MDCVMPGDDEWLFGQVPPLLSRGTNAQTQSHDGRYAFALVALQAISRLQFEFHILQYAWFPCRCRHRDDPLNENHVLPAPIVVTSPHMVFQIFWEKMSDFRVSVRLISWGIAFGNMLPNRISRHLPPNAGTFNVRFAVPR
eukprot:1178184-Prorocentrum_minimum.AAC.12